jgi:hypothetical protein
MNIPGFTAETLLSPTFTRYRSSAGQGHNLGGQKAIPQLRAGGVAVGGHSGLNFRGAGCSVCYDFYFGCAEYCAMTAVGNLGICFAQCQAQFINCLRWC